VTIAFDGSLVFAAGLATTSRFIVPIALSEDGSPRLDAGGLASAESLDDGAPFATAVACSRASGTFAVAVEGKKVQLYDRSLAFTKIIYSALLPVRALAFDDADKLM
jgi:hypothetical protein